MSRLTLRTMLHLFSNINSNALWGTTCSQPSQLHRSQQTSVSAGGSSLFGEPQTYRPCSGSPPQGSGHEEGGTTESTEVTEKFWKFLPLSSAVANEWLSVHMLCCWLDQKLEASASSQASLLCWGFLALLRHWKSCTLILFSAWL